MDPAQTRPATSSSDFSRKAPLRREHLVLPGVLSDLQKEEIFALINVLMVDTGVERKLTTLAAANLSEFRANVEGMFERVRADFQPLLFDAMNSLADKTDENITAFLTEFSSLIEKKQEVEAQLKALAVNDTVVQEAVLRVQEESLRALGNLFSAKIDAARERAADLSGSRGDSANADDLRRAMAQVKGLAKTIMGFAPLKNKEIKDHILLILEKYVAD